MSVRRAPWLCSALTAGTLLALPGGSAGAEGGTYRTVAIFGDTQDLAADPALYPGFTAMVDWVLDNREAERIDFVLHVGDAIHHGGSLPVPAACAGEDGRCDPARRWQRKNGTEIACHCHGLDLTDREWAAFRKQWQRFDGVIPYAIVRGNHDNRGVDPESPLDAPGYDQYYGESHFRGIAGSGLVASHRDPMGTSHAWRFRLGGREVLVIGAAWQFGGPAVAWAKDVLAAHPQLPAIALAHSFFRGVPPRRDQPTIPWKRLVKEHPDRFALAVSGHVAPGEISLREVGGYRILEIRSNWQGLPGSQTFLHLARFHESATGEEKIEIQAIDPARALVDARPEAVGTTWIPARPFALDAARRRVGPASPTATSPGRLEADAP